MMIADVFVDAVLGRGLAHIVQDARPVGDRLRFGPRLERIAEREHVRVGADAGIAKQVPGAANAIAALENDVALAGAFLLQMKARADAGQAGADDEDVEMFRCQIFRGHGDLRDADVYPTDDPASQSTMLPKRQIKLTTLPHRQCRVRKCPARFKQRKRKAAFNYHRQLPSPSAAPVTTHENTP